MKIKKNEQRYIQYVQLYFSYNLQILEVRQHDTNTYVDKYIDRKI